MNDADPDVSAATAQRAAQSLATIARAVDEDIGGQPTLAELIEILGWAVPTAEESLEAPSAVTRFRARLRGRRPAELAVESRVGDLGDSVFAEAADQLAALARAAGRTVTRRSTTHPTRPPHTRSCTDTVRPRPPTVGSARSARMRLVESG
jgi:hypothetical protein